MHLKECLGVEKERGCFSTVRRASDYDFVKELTSEGVFVRDIWYDKYLDKEG